MKDLAALTGLKELSLWGTNVTDAGLKELVVCKDLKSLSVIECPGVTDAGVAVLQNALPNCYIGTGLLIGSGERQADQHADRKAVVWNLACTHVF